MYVYCVVCNFVIAAPYVRSIVMSLHTIILLMMIRNVQWIMSSLYSLKIFPEGMSINYGMGGWLASMGEWRMK